MATDAEATYAAVFSLADEPSRIVVPRVALAAPDAPAATVTDVWAGGEVDPASALAIEPHGCRPLRFDPV